MNQANLEKINRIVTSSRDVKSFYESFLTEVAQMSNARVGVAWDCTIPPFHPICQIQSKSAEPTRLAISEQKHMDMLMQAAKNDRAVIVQPKSDHDGSTSDQPVLLFGPIRRESQIELVEFILPNQSNHEENQRVLLQLDQFCTLAAKFEEKTPYQQPISAPDTPAAPPVRGFAPLSVEAVDQYAHAVHADIDFKKTAQTVSNEARRLLDCDRVSVALKKGNKFRLLAVSGQPSVNKRSNTVQVLGKLVTRVLATDQAFWYPSDEELPPQIEKPLNEYLGFSATRSLAILPIHDRPIVENNDPTVTPAKPKVVAGFIVEQCNEQWDRNRVASSIETAGRHAADAMRNSLNHRQLFGYWLWRLLGKSKVVAAARNLPKTLAVLAGIIALTCLLTFVPGPFSLHSDGVLLPQQRRKVFSEVEGQVTEIFVDHGSQVDESQPLLQLTNEDLENQMQQLDGNVAALEIRLKGQQAMRLNQRDSGSRELNNENKKAMESEIESLKKRKTILAQKLEKLKVKSPIQGEVITWDLADRLRNRPVKVGDLLMEVADVDGEWEVELNLPDRRIGHLLRELKSQQESGNDDGILVTYQLAADPSRKFEGRIKKVSKATQLTADQKQGVRVIVEINTQDIDEIRQSKSGVSAKIHCGYRPLGYVWLHDVFEFVQSKVLFRIW